MLAQMLATATSGGGLDLSKVLAEAIFPESVYSFLGSEISESVVSGALVVAAIVFVALMIRIFYIPKMKMVPKGFQCFLEWLVGSFDTNAKNNVHGFSSFIAPYTLAASSYICFGVLIELIGVRPVISDINACIALSLTTFVLINFCGLKKKGFVGRVKYYVKPMWYIAPIKFITDLAVPVSMALRLFASVLSGMLVMEMIYSMVYLSFVIPAFLSIIFTLFHALMQAYIFSTLSLAFISEAME